MLEFEEDIPDYVRPIKDQMDAGNYDEARRLLQEVPDSWRETVRWSIATMTQTLL